MEIRVGDRGDVLVNWTGRGPWSVLDRDGRVTETYVGAGVTVWTDADEPTDEQIVQMIGPAVRPQTPADVAAAVEQQNARHQATGAQS